MEGKEKEMFMRQPKQVLPGLNANQLLRLRKSVYGRPDAPRAWYNEFARILEKELGFTRSVVDPALFYLRESSGRLVGMMAVRVDDVMVAIDGGKFSKGVVERLRGRFPFGTWQTVAREEAGVSYCGKELRVKGSGKSRYITLCQRGFVEGRLGQVSLSRERRKEVEARVAEVEKTDSNGLLRKVDRTLRLK